MSSDKQIGFILASQSPRRRELLERAGYYSFDVIPSSVDESQFSSHMAPVLYAQTLARAKAGEVADRYPERLVLGADTIVACDDEIIGKPDDTAHAERIVRRLFGQPHRVITGIALVCRVRKFEVVAADTTVVYPKAMTEADIAAHIRGRSWEGKAGAYAIQETGDRFVERLEGSFSNVVGLPLELLERLLKEHVV
ncbi:MAG: septum formation protein Maf [Gemmatimonadales bacterium]|nr:MAG: septum formation protein Maf [Gemmatimonadales bacterium]